MMGRQIIVKQLLSHIDGIPKVDPVVPEIKKADPLLKRKRGAGLVGFKRGRKV